MKKKLSLAGAIIAAVTLTAVPPARAAPQNGHTATNFELNCTGDEGPVTISALMQFDTGAAAVFDLTEGTNGRQYLLSSYVVDVFDPSGQLVFTYAHSYGQRTGFSHRFECQGSNISLDSFAPGFTANVSGELASK